MNRALLALLLSGLSLWGCDDDDPAGGGAITDLSDVGSNRSVRDASVFEPGDFDLGAGGGPDGAGGAGGDGVGGSGGDGGAGGLVGFGGMGGQSEACTDGMTRPCEGDCGVQRCADAEWGECEQGGAAERCDGADNDCDGLVDETYPALGIGCSVQDGACSSDGIQVCNAAGNGVECQAPPVEAEAELCDGRDNDCDNEVDEDFPGQRCCTEDIHCPPGDSCSAGMCEGGPVDPPIGGPLAGCQAPIALPGFGRYAGDNSVGAAETFGSCGGFLGPELIYTFTLPEAQRVRLDTDGSLSDTLLSVTTVCGDPFTEVACDDDGGDGLASLVEFQAQANVAYFVVVDTALLPGPFVLNFNAAGAEPECQVALDCGPGEACVDGVCAPGEPECRFDGDCPLGERCVADTCEPEAPMPDCAVDADCAGELVCRAGACVPDEPPPVGANCAGALPMNDFGVFRGTTDGRANDMASHGCQANSRGGELVWTFQLDAAAVVTLDTNETAFDTVLAVRTGCADANSEVACNDDGGEGLRSRVQFEAQAGVEYFVVVDGYNGAVGDVVLRFDGPPELDACMAPADCGPDQQCLRQICAPGNPAACADAVAAEGPGPWQGDTAAGADDHDPGCVALSNAPDATYAFVSPVDGRYRASTAGSGFDTVLYVLAACDAEIACNDDSGLGTTSEVSFDVEAGRVYYLIVDGFSDRSGAFELSLEAL